MTRITFDMSSYLKTALLVGKDLKDGRMVIFEDKEVLVNSAEYGYENLINMMTTALRKTGCNPIDCLLVYEGMNSKSRRTLMDNQYKAKRDKRCPEFYEEFARLKDYSEQLWKALGAITMSQDGVESDDVISYLATETEEDMVIASRDNDLGKLIGVNAHGATIQFYSDPELPMDSIKVDSEFFVHPPKYLTLYKALVGDSSDNIKGIKGFGPTKFQKLLEEIGYDGADELIALFESGKLTALHEAAAERHEKGKQKDKPVYPLLAALVEGEADAVRSYKLARLYPEWVTFQRPTTMNHLKFRPGKHEPPPADVDQRLKEWYGYSYLVTANEYEDACDMLREHSISTPDWDFDIESSTPAESDEWLAALGDPDGVDQLGMELTGFSITFGANKQHTIYVSVDHKDTKNITRKQAREMMEIMFNSGKEVVIQNTFFELAVIGQTADEDGTRWMDIWAKKYPQYRGFIPNVLDTKIEANYVNENVGAGLKLRSKMHLGYEQTSYEATTCKEGAPSELPAGGRVKKVLEYESICPGCGSKNFDASKMHGRCAFCDGTEGGNPPSKADIKEWNAAHDEVAFEKVPSRIIKKYKMRELTAEEVFAYGCDDTICTGALHRFYKLMMQLEHHYEVYRQVEIDPCYQHAKNFLDGMVVSIEKNNELAAHDTKTFDKAWATVRNYLIGHGWEGTVPPTYGADITAAQIKEAYKIVVLGDGKNELVIEDLGGSDGDDDGDGNSGGVVSDDASSSDDTDEDVKDAFLSTRVRTPSKLAILARELGHEMFAGMVEKCIAGENEKFTAWVREHFTGEPLFAISNKQMCKLLYEVMALPVRVRNKPTDKMRAEGKQGNPKGDVLALAYAVLECTPEQKEVIDSLKLMTMVKTRRSLYYSKYPYFVHWKTGRVHPTHNQSKTNTRRASESKPNKQQLPKHPKITGEPSRFREVIVPHHPDAVIVSLDFDSQELRVIADYSKDPNMVSAFVGDNKKSLHSLTGHSIALKKKAIPAAMEYLEFDKAAKNKESEFFKVCAEYRALGKKVNFTTEFGAMAPKLALTMLVPEAEAQTYIDAKEEMFPIVRKWKTQVISDSKRDGIVRTKMGAVRHLAEAYMSDDYWRKSKAERQAVNFKVQSSSAEMTKLAEGRMWQTGLTYKYDCICYGPVHDETVFSVMKKDLVAFLKDAHWCMTQPYADMEIPIESSISFGPSFGEQVEIGIVPSEEAVAKGWAEVEKVFSKAKQAAAVAA